MAILVVYAGVSYEEALNMPMAMREKIAEKIGSKRELDVELERQKLLAMRKMWTGK